MNREIDLDEVRRNFNIEFEIRENKLYCSDFSGYIKNDNTYSKMQKFCEDICDYIEEKYECFTDYSILDEGYEFVIEVF